MKRFIQVQVKAHFEYRFEVSVEELNNSSMGDTINSLEKLVQDKIKDRILENLDATDYTITIVDKEEFAGKQIEVVNKRREYNPNVT
jgi:hypothetical protein